MKQKVIELSQRYVTVLRQCLRQSGQAGLQPALALGRQAAALGLETLALARIHERALATLSLDTGTSGPIKRAEKFFNQAMIPIVETHQAARQSKSDLKRLNQTLHRRTLELATSNRQCQRGMVQRERAEAALRQSGRHYPKLLEESLRLQAGLRKLTHQNFSAQEKERQTISHQLQDEIAQTLLSIQVRLLNLRTAAKGNKLNLTKEIASTQRLVEASVRSINRVARALSIQQPA